MLKITCASSGQFGFFPGVWCVAASHLHQKVWTTGFRNQSIRCLLRCWALMISKLDYCYSLLADVPSDPCNWSRKQINTFSSIPPGTPTPTHRWVHLTLDARIIFKTRSLACNSTNRQVPTYRKPLAYQVPHCTTFPLSQECGSCIAQDTRKTCIKKLLGTGTKVLE